MAEQHSGESCREREQHSGPGESCRERKLKENQEGKSSSSSIYHHFFDSLREKTDRNRSTGDVQYSPTLLPCGIPTALYKQRFSWENAHSCREKEKHASPKQTVRRGLICIVGNGGDNAWDEKCQPFYLEERNVEHLRFELQHSQCHSFKEGLLDACALFKKAILLVECTFSKRWN